MAVEITNAKNPIFGQYQVGFWPKNNRCLLKCNDYDQQWAVEEGLTLKENERLVRVENALTRIENGIAFSASIAKINIQTGSIAFTVGEEGQASFGWDRMTKSNLILQQERL